MILFIYLFFHETLEKACWFNKKLDAASAQSIYVLFFSSFFFARITPGKQH